MDIPSELLTRAADLIRDRAANTTPGPWAFEDSAEDFDGAVYQQPTGEEVAFSRSTSIAIQDANGRWIALLNPSIAPALEFWLRHAAEMVKPFDQGYTTSAYCAERGALAFAHALLGLDTPEEAK